MICRECGGPIYPNCSNTEPIRWWHSDDWDTVVLLSKQASVKPIHEAVPMFTVGIYL